MFQQSSIRLFFISFAALFLEILAIRWISSEVLVFCYFKNLILMGAVVGLGLGCASGNKTTGLSALFPYLFLLLTTLLCFAGPLGITGLNFVLGTDVYFWLERKDVVSSVAKLCTNALWVLGIFLLVLSIFDALGQILGGELAKHPPLKAYGANLAGSLAGVVTYSLLAFLQTPPSVWLFVGLATLLPFFKRPPQLAAIVATVIVSLSTAGETAWSPYYRIDTVPFTSKEWGGTEKPYQLGYELMVNHATFQRTLDFSALSLVQHPELKNSAEYIMYNLPYQLKPHADEVLILGAGSGNDVASALRNGAKHIDAVEIDPLIAQGGKTHHREKPYESPHLNLFIQDARTYISQGSKLYDLISFGFVDSHVSFSMLSSVRLDNFLYTTESIKLATKHLKTDGIAVLSFAAGAPWLKSRLYQMVRQAWGQEPLALKSTMSNPNSIVIVWGPGLTSELRQRYQQEYKDLVIPASQLSVALPLSTDDWPFLYQKERALTLEYTSMLALLIAITGFLTVSRFRLGLESFAQNWQFFLLGAGFLLLETRVMLSIAILFGSTWIVNSITIGLILLMALLANWLVSRLKSVNIYLAYAGLLASLVILYMVPLSNLLELDILPKLVLAAMIVGLPFAFSGIVFSASFAKTGNTSQALGFNILGALLGGCCEYMSVIVGTRAIGLIALLIYALSAYAIFSSRSNKVPQVLSD